MAQIPVQRASGAAIWPWVALFLLVAVGVAIWAITKEETVTLRDPARTDQPTVVVVDPDVGDVIAAEVARDAAVTASVLVDERPTKGLSRNNPIVSAPMHPLQRRRESSQYLDIASASLLAGAAPRHRSETPYFWTDPKLADRFDKDHLVVEERIFFAYASAELTPTGRAKLDDIAAELAAAGPWKTLKINGHSDRRGPKDYNLELSRDRAKAVEGHLAALGVKEDKLDIKAYGDSRPLEIDASTHEQYQRNRRVEFTIVRAP